MSPRHDFNVFERQAAQAIGDGRPRDAMAIYLFMGDSDPSLDAEYLAERIGHCAELLGELHAAKWSYGRAVEENPTIAHHVEARRRLNHVSINPLFASEEWRRALLR